MPNPIIVALDTDSPFKALSMVRRLKVTGVAFKVGFELFCAGGPKVVEKIINQDVRVFLDLKYHDIPTTVAKVSEVVSKMGVWMFNVHASGGMEMMKAAKESSVRAAKSVSLTPPILLAVTVLTSMASVKEMGVKSSVADHVLLLASLAEQSGLDGVVASAQEAQLIRQKMGSKFTLVTPGIRLPEDENGDQKRVLTPQQALQSGANYLVIGRPITQSKKPFQVIEQIKKSVGA